MSIIRAKQMFKYLSFIMKVRLARLAGLAYFISVAFDLLNTCSNELIRKQKSPTLLSSFPEPPIGIEPMTY